MCTHVVQVPGLHVLHGDARDQLRGHRVDRRRRGVVALDTQHFYQQVRDGILTLWKYDPLN